MEIPYFTDNPEVFHKSTAPTAIITDFSFHFLFSKAEGVVNMKIICSKVIYKKRKYCYESSPLKDNHADSRMHPD